MDSKCCCYSITGGRRGTTQELIRRLNLIVNRIELGDADLSIHLSPVGLRQLLNLDAGGSGIAHLIPKDFILSTPVHYRRCGMEVKLIVGE